jgi:hypothetical protein
MTPMPYAIDAENSLEGLANDTCSEAARRMRLHRERRRLSLRCHMIELRETEIDALINRGLLETEMRNDTTAVRKALYAHLERTLT